MAIKLPALGLFRTEVRTFIEKNPYDCLTEEQQVALNEFLSELKSLAIEGKIDNTGEHIVGPHVSLLVRTEFTEESADPERSVELFHQIHNVLLRTFVPRAIYREMGRALIELGVEEVDPDLRVVINEATYGTRLFGSEIVPDIRDFPPSVVINREREKRGQERI